MEGEEILVENVNDEEWEEHQRREWFVHPDLVCASDEDDLVSMVRV